MQGSRAAARSSSEQLGAARSSSEQLGCDPGFRALVGIALLRRCAAQQIVIAEDGHAGKLYGLVAGLATVRATDREGREMLLAYLYPGDFCGEMCLFPRRDSRSAMIRASTECSLLEIPYEPSIELTSKHPSLWMALTGQLAERRRAINHRLAITSDHGCGRHSMSAASSIARTSVCDSLHTGMMLGGNP